MKLKENTTECIVIVLLLLSLLFVVYKSQIYIKQCDNNIDIKERQLKIIKDEYIKSYDQYDSISKINSVLLNDVDSLNTEVLQLSKHINTAINDLMYIERDIDDLIDSIVFIRVEEILNNRVHIDTSTALRMFTVNECKAVIKMNDSLDIVTDIIDLQQTTIATLDSVNNNLLETIDNKNKQLSIKDVQFYTKEAECNIYLETEKLKNKKTLRQRNVFGIALGVIICLLAVR